MKRPEATQPPRAFSFCRCCRLVLEVELQPELDQALPTVGDYLRERGAFEAVVIHSQKLDVVESVEELRAEFERLVLHETGSLGERDIPIVDSRPPQIITGHVSVAKQRNAGVAKGIGARILVGTGGAT